MPETAVQSPGTSVCNFTILADGGSTPCLSTSLHKTGILYYFLELHSCLRTTDVKLESYICLCTVLLRGTIVNRTYGIHKNLPI